MTTES